MNIKATLTVAAMVAASWMALGGKAEAAPLQEGCVAAMGTSCEYVAKTSGGIVAAGNGWRVNIFRGARSITLGPKDLTDLEGGLRKQANVVRRGDRVVVRTAIPVGVCCFGATFGIVGVGPDFNG